MPLARGQADGLALELPFCPALGCEGSRGSGGAKTLPASAASTRGCGLGAYVHMMQTQCLFHHAGLSP